MIRKGSLVVPLPNRYLPSIYHGKVGKVDLAGRKGQTLTAHLFSVKFEGLDVGGYKLFRKNEVRAATTQEKRGYHFVRQVHEIGTML